MAKKRKSFISILAFVCSALMALGIVNVVGGTRVSAEPASENTVTETNVLNIEDAIHSMDDVKWFRDGYGYYSSMDPNEKYKNSGKSYGIYTTTAAGADSEDYSYSKNGYEGNLSFYSSDDHAFHSLEVAGTSKNDLLTFNTIWTPQTSKGSGQIIVYFRRSAKMNNVDANRIDGGGYKLIIAVDYTNFAKVFKSTSNNEGGSWAKGAGTDYFDDATLTFDTMKKAYNEKNGTSITNQDAIIKGGDIVTIQVGAYDAEDGYTHVVLNVYNVTKKIQVVDNWEITDKTSDTETGYSEGSSFYIATHSTNRKVANTQVGRSTMIGGVNRPILGKNYTATGSYYEDGNVVDVAEELAGTGYELKSTEGIFKAGENKLSATYMGEYYNQTSYTRDDVYVIVNANTINKPTMKIVDKDGTVLKSDRLKTGETYTLECEAVGSKLIGFKESENFYPVGKSFTVGEETKDTTFTAVFVDFETLAGAQVRMLSDEKGYAGIRFTSRIAKADNDAWGSLFTLKAVMIPTDMIVGEFDYNETGAETFTFTKENYLENGENYELNFGKTDILYSNYNREFSARTYLEVTYSDNTTAIVYDDYDTANNSRSIYDVARILYGKQEAAIREDGVGLYSTANAAYLESYVATVVDIGIGEEGAISSADIGLDLTKTFTVSGSVSENTVTLTVVFNEDVDERYFVEDKLYIPVNVWNGNSYTRVQTPEVSYDSSTKTATITFTKG